MGCSCSSQADKQDFLKKVKGQGENARVLLRNATSAVRADKNCVLAAVREDGYALDDALGNLNQDQEVVMAAVSQNGNFLYHAHYSLKRDKEVVLAAVSQSGYALDVAHETLKQDKDVVLAAVSQNGRALQYAHDTVKRDKEVVMAAVSQFGNLLHHARDLQRDKEVVLAAVSESGDALQYAHEYLKQDREVVMAAVKNLGDALRHAHDYFKRDKEAVLAAVTQNGNALSYASDSLKEDVEVVMVACGSGNTDVLDKNAYYWSDKELVLSAVRKNGSSLQHASNDLRKDKEVVMAAVKNKGSALKFALDRLNQDLDFLKAAGLLDEDGSKIYARVEKATLSIKFSLAENSTTYSTEFAKGMKEDEFLSNFKTYNPNLWYKKSCDPELTDMMHPCRGSLSTCKFQNKNLHPDTQRPWPESCWRFAFRFHQQESKESNGFMIQVEEKNGLGGGQKIETAMAREVKLKVFRTYTNMSVLSRSGLFDGMKVVSKAIQEWYDSDCANTDLENVFIGSDKPGAPGYTTRPKYETL